MPYGEDQRPFGGRNGSLEALWGSEGGGLAPINIGAIDQYARRQTITFFHVDCTVGA